MVAGAMMLASITRNSRRNGRTPHHTANTMAARMGVTTPARTPTFMPNGADWAPLALKEDRGSESDDDPENTHGHEMAAPRLLRFVLEKTLEAAAEIERSKLSAQRTIDVCSVWLEIGDWICSGEAGETQQMRCSGGGEARSESRVDQAAEACADDTIEVGLRIPLTSNRLATNELRGE